MRSVVMLAVVALAGLTGVAQAGSSHPWMDAGPTNWSGKYLGVNGGVGLGTLKWAYTPSGTTANQSPTGAVAGVTAGFNIQQGQIVYGLEGDLDWAGIEGSASCPNPLFACNTTLSWLGTLRGRIGVTQNNMLLYVTGGLAAGSLYARTTFTPGIGLPPSGTPTNGTTTTDIGWTAGIGSEFALHSGLSLKGEWLLYDLGTSSHPVDNGLTVLTNATGSLLRVGLNKRF